MYDFVVVGAGIAGLAIAELIQRSGRSVLLLESESQICTKSSAQQQGWFHTGALYAAMPSGRYFRQLVGNLDDLLNYYSCFPAMNLGSGRLLLTRCRDGWFGNSTNFYFYASPRDPSLRAWQRPLWQLAILRAQARLSWFETIDFTRELSPQITAFDVSINLGRCVSRRAFDFSPGVVAKILKSRDRSFDAVRIMTDLLNAFLSNGGVLKTNSCVAHIDKGTVSDEHTTYRARNVILTTGRLLKDLSGINVNVFKSPLLVVKPSIIDVNFVWMTMKMSETINHIHHENGQGNYSLFGNAVYFPAEQPVDEESLKRRILDRTGRILGQELNETSAALYFGYKTDVLNGRSRRDYQYHIINGKNCVVAVPGKMSLAFSLAVNVCRHYGIDSVAELRALADQGASAAVSQPEHYKRFASLP